ncbi:GNAT family N-acetyltransferase [Pontibacter anaerobius]|uniref:GNAT family N-acetyltransferase n=1 Tax=Pontibacter anaerobius TaxID=2993940 RepID=A0ABT3RL13_9BACT|nr:GNAT family N-acetyltransferase [Pontibacter anaerobius]MCX2742188.1 GNAT family N-acetyltransferase [Pontibacter anaerobius]
MIIKEKYSELNPFVRSTLSRLVEEQFGHVPFVQEREWALPDWVLAKYEHGEIATVCHVVLRDVSMDGQEYKVAGINNVITPKSYRGKGFASQVLREAEMFIFGELDCTFGMLLCADDLLLFYSRLGWYKLDEYALYYHQPTGEQRYDSNVMLLSPPEQGFFFPKHIHLNGLPW